MIKSVFKTLERLMLKIILNKFIYKQIYLDFSYKKNTAFTVLLRFDRL